MKFIKKLLVVLLSFIISFCLMLLILTTGIKNVVNDSISQLMYSQILNDGQIDEQLDADQSKQLKKILQNNEVQNLTNEFIDSIILSLDGESKFNYSTLDGIFEYMLENKSTIEKEMGIEVTIDNLDDFKNSEAYEEMKVEIDSIIEEGKNEIGSDGQTVLKTYNYLSSNQFKILLVGIIAACLLVIALLQKSIINWMKTLGRCLVTSGVMMLVLSYTLEKAIVSIMEDSISITVGSLYLYSGIAIGIGIILIIVQKMLKKVINTADFQTDNREISNSNSSKQLDEGTDEVSEISEE